MIEADRLCDRIAIIDKGKIKACDAPARLKQEIGGDIVQLSLDGPAAARAGALAALAAAPGVKQVKPQDDHVLVVVEDGEAAVPALFAAVHALDVRITSITVKRPTLDDVYLHFTGRDLRDDQEGSKEESFRRRMVMRRARR
jgi:ABC-2 type transport system ATP-binding protein